MFGFFRHFFKLQFLLIIFAIIAGIYYPHIFKRFRGTIFSENSETWSAVQDANGVFTKEQLSKFNGNNGAPIYLAILGNVYDVSKSEKHYGQDCAYNFFVGRDASMSFVTGEFEKFIDDQADDVLTLNRNDWLSLANWKEFYEKEYTYKGKLIGRFYDGNGQPTSYHYKFLALLEQAKEAKAAVEQLSVKYPDCNIEWSESSGTRVWCTSSSGGKEREWSGHPRKYFAIGNDSYRCACIRTDELDTTAIMIKPYENCDRFAHECYYNID